MAEDRGPTMVSTGVGIGGAKRRKRAEPTRSTSTASGVPEGEVVHGLVG